MVTLEMQELKNNFERHTIRLSAATFMVNTRPVLANFSDNKKQALKCRESGHQSTNKSKIQLNFKFTKACEENEYGQD